MQNNVTVIIPIYNEAENIWLLIDEIFNKYKYIKILVVDDFSIDDSITIVNNKINKYRNNLEIFLKNNKKDKWLTKSIILGIQHINTDYFIVMDWDFQHPVANLENFINFFKNWKNIVVWERRKIIFEEKKYRIILSKLWNFLINLKIKKKWFYLNDPLTWFFGWRKDFFVCNISENRENFICSWYKFLFEFLKIIKKESVNLWIFSFDFWKRRFGVSKISSQIHIDFIKWLFKK
jgi:dolichol-phosphate mannosyltransferase